MTQRIAISLPVIFLGLAIGAHSARAQAIAIIDIGKVFDSHSGFKKELETLRIEAESLQQSVNQQRQKLAGNHDSLALQFTPGSDEYRKQEKELAMSAASLDLDANTRMQELMTREANVHYHTYQEVNRYIAQYCEETGVRLVLRHSNIAMQPENPESIMQTVNAPIIYHLPERDITEIIVARMLEAKGGINK
jgi:Skp family chaperone for outer membrane proteins